MKALKFSLVTAMVMSSFVAVKAQTVDEIMSKHLNAIGSKDAWANIKTIKMDGTMSVQGMDVAITQTMVPGKAVRTDISVMGMSGYTIFTKTDGWMYLPFQGQTKPEPAKPEMVKAAQSQLELKSRDMFDYKTNGTKIDFLGKDTVNKVVCYKLKFTDKDGSETNTYFDASSYYLIRTESKIKQDDQEQEIAMGYDNYKKLDGGVAMPMNISTTQGDITFKSIELNKAVDEEIFKPTVPKTETAPGATYKK